MEIVIKSLIHLNFVTFWIVFFSYIYYGILKNPEKINRSAVWALSLHISLYALHFIRYLIVKGISMPPAIEKVDGLLIAFAIYSCLYAWRQYGKDRKQIAIELLRAEGHKYDEENHKEEQSKQASPLHLARFVHEEHWYGE